MFDFLSEKFSSVFARLTGRDKLTEANVEEILKKIHDSLLEADVPLAVANRFLQEVKNEVVGQKVATQLKPQEQFVSIVHNKIVQFLSGTHQHSTFVQRKGGVVLVMGLQGSGKTTTIAKLAHHLRGQGVRRILCASVDFYRPAAIDQLEMVVGQAGASFFRAKAQEPCAAAREIMATFREGRYDLLFLDTAGRLHVDDRMLQELRDLNELVRPTDRVLVLDAMTGQESLRVAQAFEKDVGFDGAILTKMDSEARGGAAFAFRYQLGKPILFVGTGEKIGELEAFKPERVAKRMLGMGDIQTLAEKADQKIKRADQEALARKMMDGSMTLQDFADQMAMVGRLGSLSSIIKYLPGIPAQALTPEKLEQGEAEIKRFRAIISSMTPRERRSQHILDASRKQRIARGAGVRSADVDVLLHRFEESRQFAKLFKRFGKFPGLSR